MNKLLLNKTEFARILGISRSTLNRLIKEKLIPQPAVGKYWTHEQIESFFRATARSSELSKEVNYES